MAINAQDQPVPAPSSATREEDAIYQNGQVVAHVLDPEISAESKRIHFGEVYGSDYLILPDECEFRNHRILIRKIGYATKEEKQSLHKGRILRDVMAEIL